VMVTPSPPPVPEASGSSRRPQPGTSRHTQRIHRDPSVAPPREKRAGQNAGYTGTTLLHAQKELESQSSPEVLSHPRCLRHAHPKPRTDSGLFVSQQAARRPQVRANTLSHQIQRLAKPIALLFCGLRESRTQRRNSPAFWRQAAAQLLRRNPPSQGPTGSARSQAAGVSIRVVAISSATWQAACVLDARLPPPPQRARSEGAAQLQPTGASRCHLPARGRRGDPGSDHPEHFSRGSTRSGVHEATMHWPAKAIFRSCFGARLAAAGRGRLKLC